MLILQDEYKVGGWIQVDFLTPVQVTGVITQGRGPSSRNEHWVETYEILYGDDVSNLSTVSNWGGSGANNIVSSLIPYSIMCVLSVCSFIHRFFFVFSLKFTVKLTGELNQKVICN